MAKSWSEAEVIALIAQLIGSGGKVDNQHMTDVTGKSTAVGYQHKMRAVIRHAKLVTDDRSKGGKGLLSSLTGFEDASGTTSTPALKTKRKSDAINTDDEGALTPSKRGRRQPSSVATKVRHNEKLDGVTAKGKHKHKKVAKEEVNDNEPTKAMGGLAAELDTEYEDSAV